jgi:hypothetical protein
MTTLKIRSFGGIAPKLNARYLPENRAQQALNVDTTRDGSLNPIRKVGSNVKSLAFTPKTLFRMRPNSVSGDSDYWVASSYDVSFCRSQVIEDTSELVYYTFDTRPSSDKNYNPSFSEGTNAVRTDTSTNAQGILGLSNTWYGLGVPAPTQALTISPQNTPADVDGLSREFRSYVYTYVWKKAGREMESAPSPASSSEGIYLADGVSMQVSNFKNIPSGDTRPVGMVDADLYVRIYRAVGGAFLLVNTAADILITTAVGGYNDTVEAADLGEALPSLGWTPPPSDLKGLTNMANGMMAGFSGQDVYFCEPYIPHAWPIAYTISVDSPIVALASLDTTLVVLTAERPYYVQGSSPEYLTVVAADANQGCVSKDSVATINGEVYFASPDGLLTTSPRGTRNITEGFFSYRQWNDLLDPTTIKGFTHDQKYFAFHSQGGLIYDLPTREFVTTTYDVDAGYVDTRLDELYIVTSGTVRSWAGSVLAGRDAYASVQWKSKVFGFPSEISFSCGQVEAESYVGQGGSGVQVQIYADGTKILDQFVTNRNLFRLPSVLARDWEVYVRANDEVFNITLAQSGEELASV